MDLLEKEIWEYQKGSFKMKIERTAGFVTRVGDVMVKTLSLPDWDLYYIEFPEEEKAEYLKTLHKARIRIQRVFPTRIYFEENV